MIMSKEGCTCQHCLGVASLLSTTAGAVCIRWAEASLPKQPLHKAILPHRDALEQV